MDSLIKFIKTHISKSKRPKKYKILVSIYKKSISEGEDSPSRKEIKAKSKLKYTESKQNGRAKTRIEKNSIFACETLFKE